MTGCHQGVLYFSLEREGEAAQIVCALDTLDDHREEMLVLAVVDELVAQTGVLDLLDIELNVTETVAEQMPDDRTGVGFTGSEGALNPNAFALGFVGGGDCRKRTLKQVAKLVCGYEGCPEIVAGICGNVIYRQVILHLDII